MLTSSKETFSATSRLIFAQYLGQMAHSRWHTILCTTTRPGFSCEPLFPSLYRDPGTSQVLSEHLAHGRLDRLVIAYNPLEDIVFEIIFFQKKKSSKIKSSKSMIFCLSSCWLKVTNMEWEVTLLSCKILREERCKYCNYQVNQQNLRCKVSKSEITRSQRKEINKQRKEINTKHGKYIISWFC